MSLDPTRQELDLSVIEMVNKHSEQVRAQERQKNLNNAVRYIDSAHRSTPSSRTYSRNTSQIRGVNRNLERDTFVSSKGRRVQKKKSNIPIKVGATLTAALTACGIVIGKWNSPTPSGDDIMPPVAIVETNEDYGANESELFDDEKSFHYSEAPSYAEAAPEQEIQTMTSNGQKLLDELQTTGGLAFENFDTLCESFNLSKEEMADKIVYMCESEDWGKNCTTPLLLCAQMYHESYYVGDKTGDGGDALGIGQFHKCAVDDVNRVFGTNYKYEDRSNPEKALEMMCLYLRYCYNQTGSRTGMLAMYNAGHADAIEHQYGKNYVNNVLEKINESISTFSDNYRE